MKHGVKKVLALLCAVAMLLGMFSTFALAVGNPVYSDLDNEKDDMGAEISVMSFNILDYFTYNYEDYGNNDNATRLSVTVGTIGGYDPDIVGIQEAGNDKVYDWPANLDTNLSDAYDSVKLCDQEGGPSEMTINAGLIIYYRKGRFTKLDDGCYNFNITKSNGGQKRTDSSRWYQWAKLQDTWTNQTFFVFNTHFAIRRDLNDDKTIDDNETIITKMIRTEQAKLLSDKIHSLSANYPCFATGDYNSDLHTSVADQKDGQSYIQLRQMSASPHAYLRSSIEVADLKVMVSETTIDHVFINTNYLDCRKLVGIRESVNGSSSSDHYAYISYCNYRPKVTITPGTYDDNAGTHTDKVDVNSYTYAVTPATSNLTYKIFDSNGNPCSNTVQLNNSVNKFEIRFYNTANSSALYDTITSTITYTGADKPILQLDGGVNTYFANGAYQVLVDTDSIVLRPQGGTLYTTEACTTKLGNRITGIAGGRTTYYLKSSLTGDVFPVKIYKENQPASTYAKAYYVDDDIGAAVGTVAFVHGNGKVTFIEGQVKGFDQLNDLRNTINQADGCILYVAGGNYDSVDNTFNSSVTILGPNYNIAPFVRNRNAAWTDSNRYEEAVINGQLHFSIAGYTETDTITVKGLKFTGTFTNGHIYIEDNRITSARPMTDYKIHMDITNNIFAGYPVNNTVNGSIIHANSASQKNGVIANNLFDVGGSFNYVNKETNVPSTAFARGIFARNLNGLVIESNRFVNLGYVLWLASEVSHQSTDATGYGVYTVQGNRFEACRETTNRIRNIRDNVSMDVRYIDNTFVRSGYSGTIINVNLTEAKAGAGTDFSKCKLTISDNRFFGCLRSIGIYRNHLTDIDSSTAISGDMNKMTVNINQNVIYDPTERTSENTDYTTFNNPSTSSITFNFVQDSSKTPKALSSTWNLKYNYFYSNRVRIDGNGYSENSRSISDPAKYVSKIYTLDGTDQDSFTTAISGTTTSAAFVPYYYGNNPLSLTSLYPNSTTLGTITGITANDVTVTYDGKPHSVSVTGPSGSLVSYSTNSVGGDGAAYTALAPTYTDPGTYTAAYRVTQPGCTTVYGTVKLTISETDGDRTAIQDQTVTYSCGKVYNLGELTKLDGDTITYTYNGVTYDSMPSFTEVGVYPVTIKATNPLYTPYTQTATLTINKASLENVTIGGGYEGAYDGANHNVTISGAARDVLIEYSLDGGEFTTTKPANFNAVTDGAHTVTVRLSSSNYISRTKDVVFNITPATISDVTLTPNPGLKETGAALQLVTVAGTVSGDTVQYAVSGGAFTKTAPTAMKAGTYTVAVKISRANHTDKTLVTNVVIEQGTVITPSVFALTVNSASVTEAEDNTSTFKWTLGLATGAGAAAAESEDFKVLSYGVKYAADKANLEDYIFFMNYAQTDAAEKLVTDSKVAEIAYDEFETGVTTLYATNNLHITNTAPQRARYAAFYIRYQIGATVYEQYSDVQSISNLPGSVVGGSDTVSVDDILVNA